MRKIIAVIGDGMIEEGGVKEQTAFELGKALVDAGYRIQSGGLKGIMKAAFRGAHASEKYREGDTVAILPSFDIKHANEYADIVIPTGLDLYRNTIVASASAVIAVGGGSGTLSEIANAWAMRRLIIGMTCVEGWSNRLAGQRLDNRKRTDIEEDKIFGAATVAEAIALLEKYLPAYTESYGGIPKVERSK